MDKELPVSAWPEWKIIEKIGEGSFGKVYKAQRTERGKSFYSAIKIINIPGSQSELNSVRSETGDEQSTRQYFQNLVEECIQEISTMEYFRGNSYIVSVEDFKVMEYLDVIGWEISIRMEYLTSFMDYCAEKQLTEKEVIKLGMDLSKALEYCRKLKIIHRVDTNDQIPNENGENTFAIPEFEGSLMFKIDGVSGKDVTSVFLLINMDKEPPVLTLSSDIFYADNESGDYTITGISDAGSRIMYGDNEEVVAGSDGKFAISGKLYESQTSGVIMLCAQDFAGNTSTPQTALVIKKISNTVTVNDSYAENSGSGEYSEGETVTIKAGERSGYKFSGWMTDDGVQFADSKSAETTFTMPSKAVTVIANWTKSSGGNGGGGGNVRYTVSFETNGGNDIASKTVTKNSVIKEPKSPIKDGFDFEGWYTDKGLKTKYDFTEKVTKNFTLYAKWTEKDNGEWKNPFTDVKENDWFYDSVKYAYENDLMKGISNTEFAPDSEVTRAMFVTVIYRMENEPQTGKYAFTDVESGSYYESAVAWANENGIVSGISEDCFAPNEPITREQMAAIIYRYAAFKGYDITTSSNTSYTDNDNISDYAKDAVIWAAEKSVMTGNTDGSFSPKSNTTRAQAASVFMRMVENLK